MDQLPGFAKAPFKVYSGYLTVPGPVAGYEKLDIHYQFHEAQTNPSRAPVATWHQGGPGGSSMYGAYAEMGYFQVNGSATYVNEYAWNKVANMLYLESPAGSGQNSGFSICYQGGQPTGCSWNDTSQGEAYAKTLREFYNQFPEYKVCTQRGSSHTHTHTHAHTFHPQSNDLYLTGESYSGQYIPNIAYYIQNNPSVVSNLKGIMVGNGCWGGDANTVNCNGPNSDQNNADMFWGKGLVSKKTYEHIYKVCPFPDTSSSACQSALNQIQTEVGPYNIYDIYDNCPQNDAWLEKAGKTKRWLHEHLVRHMPNPQEGRRVLDAMQGGYDWSCGGMAAEANYMLRADVQKALHLTKGAGVSSFNYYSSGPASVTLYPHLIGKIRVLIYNGDSDACVPYKGNEEWTTSMVTKGVVTQTKAWHPWYAGEGIPAGYLTSYTKNFAFITIRLAGHMVPTFQPKPALTFFERYLAGTYA